MAVGLVGALALSTPAFAHHTYIDGDWWCDTETGEWVVDWTVTSSPHGESYWLTAVTHEPGDTSLTGLTLNQEQPRDEPFEGQQRLPGDQTQAALTVSAEWNNGHTDGPRTGDVEFEGSCEQQERPTVDWQLTCDGIAFEATNPSGSPHTIVFQIVGDDHFRVDVEPGATATSTIEVGEGTTVLVTHGEETLATIAWEEPDGCEPTEKEGGGAAGEDELPATGSPTTWIVAAAVALLLIGGGLFVSARRRGTTFAA